ncbi:hypothetical protein ISN45_Aa01g020060 [Arabidopsis thaliana x Arabidopsis arenosa]|uniref:Uncharacterized protein n=1 Tax=Arabidopsis thaliana x Arabidopsis arenosa TaxID=1240361 RepID=A0A8T2C5T7_9BRAS|nr:hypothetical protein ISN45_Aa01g020060 [Arabidopsis thaliana x Arabidopsis arenosa]
MKLDGRRFQLRIQNESKTLPPQNRRFQNDSNRPFLRIALPLRFLALPGAPVSDSNSEAGIGAPPALPCNVALHWIKSKYCLCHNNLLKDVPEC